MIDDKKSHERDKISTNDEEKVTEDIEILKHGKFSSQKKKDYLENKSDEINQRDMSDDNKSDERDHM